MAPSFSQDDLRTESMMRSSTEVQAGSRNPSAKPTGRATAHPCLRQTTPYSSFHPPINGELSIVVPQLCQVQHFILILALCRLYLADLEKLGPDLRVGFDGPFFDIFLAVGTGCGIVESSYSAWRMLARFRRLRCVMICSG